MYKVILMVKRKIKNLITIITIATTLGIFSLSGFSNKAFSEAVPLIQIDTGNNALDEAIPHFYSCINHAVKSNQHDDSLDSYFQHEPTKHEVITCYQKTIKNSHSHDSEGEN